METGVIILWILAVVLVASGVAGLVLPALPGAPLILGGLVMGAWAEDFTHVGAITIVILTLLTLFASLLDFLAGAFGATRFGASKKAMIGAAAGVFVGLFFGIPGVIIGPFIGAVLGELLSRKGLRAAGMAGIGTWLGMVIGAAAKLAVGLVMIGIFLAVRFL